MLGIAAPPWAPEGDELTAGAVVGFVVGAASAVAGFSLPPQPISAAAEQTTIPEVTYRSIGQNGSDKFIFSDSANVLYDVPRKSFNFAVPGDRLTSCDYHAQTPACKPLLAIHP
jgi:hypothetical protein